MKRSGKPIKDFLPTTLMALALGLLGSCVYDSAVEEITVSSESQEIDCTDGQCGDDPDACWNRCHYNSCGVMCKGLSGGWQTCESSSFLPHYFVKRTPAIAISQAQKNHLQSLGWSINSSTQYICHLDPDFHWDGTDNEFWVVDRYEDLRCHNPAPGFWYRKRKAGEKHCSLGQHLEDWATGGFDFPALESGECAANTAAKMAALNLVPIFSESDRDECPHPRL